ncbi:MAG TPA: hypothetical protein VMB26_14900 [Candidatus Binataceae bacterium]|nr:hypothetical protein [Candidatus Binataceae bacterium]
MKILGTWPLTKETLPGREQAVIISMRLSNDHFGSEAEDKSLAELEAEIEKCLAGTKHGEWDGHETGSGYHKIFVYGPCAERLSEAILPTVLAYAALPGSYMVKRFGEIGSDEQYIWLDSGLRA